MRLCWLSTILLATSFGCQAPSSGSAVAAQAQMGSPAADQEGTFALNFDNRSVRLGQSLDQLKGDHPMPEGANLISNPPANFPPPYTAWGWSKAGTGLGVIAYEGRVAVAVKITERSDSDEVASLYSLLKALDPDDTRIAVTGRRASYWFLDRKASRKALCAITSDGNDRKIVEAIGDVDLMHELRLSPESARQDVAKSDGNGL